MRVTKVQILKSSAIELFMQYGIKRVTVEDILNHSGVSKGTFYKYYPNKISLVKEIISDINNESVKKFNSMMKNHPSFKEIVKFIFTEKQEFMSKYTDVFIKDLYNGSVPEVGEIIAEMQKNALSRSHDIYSYLVNKGDISKKVKYELFVYLLNNVQSMYLDKKVVDIYPDPVERMEIIFNTFFYGILNHKQKME